MECCGNGERFALAVDALLTGVTELHLASQVEVAYSLVQHKGLHCLSIDVTKASVPQQDLSARTVASACTQSNLCVRNNFNEAEQGRAAAQLTLDHLLLLSVHILDPVLNSAFADAICRLSLNRLTNVVVQSRIPWRGAAKPRIPVIPDISDVGNKVRNSISSSFKSKIDFR